MSSNEDSKPILQKSIGFDFKHEFNKSLKSLQTFQVTSALKHSEMLYFRQGKNSAEHFFSFLTKINGRESRIFLKSILIDAPFWNQLGKVFLLQD